MRNIDAISAADDPQQIYQDTFSFCDALMDPINHSRNYTHRVQTMRLCHEPGAEAQLDVVNAFGMGIQHVFIRHPSAGIVIRKNGHHYVELLKICHNISLLLCYLDVRA